MFKETLKQKILSLFQKILSRKLSEVSPSQSPRLQSPKVPLTTSPTHSSSQEKQPPSTTLSNIQAEIRREQTFSLAKAIGREGGSFMKGESAIPRPLRATTRISQFITTHAHEPTGAFATALFTWASTDIRVSRQLDTPLIALHQIIHSLLSDPTTFCEFARQVAIAQSKITGDRPYFQQYKQPAHPEAEQTHQTIRTELTELLTHLSQPEP